MIIWFQLCLLKFGPSFVWLVHSLKLLGNLFYLIVLARLIAFVEKQGGPISHPINVFKAAVRRALSQREFNSVGKFNRGNEPKAQNMIKPRQLLPMTQDTFSSEMQWVPVWHKGDACEKSHAAVWSPVSEGKLSVHPHPAGRLWRGETRAVWSHYNMSQSLLPCEIISPACASPFNQPGSCFR